MDNRSLINKHQENNIRNNNEGLNRSNTAETNKLNNSVMSVNVQLILKQIFEFYCQFGERLNTQYLKSHKFFKFAQDANFYDNTLTKIKLELIYKSQVGNNQLMDFKSFLNSLIKIADFKYNSKNLDSSDSNKSIFQSGHKLSSGPAYLNKSNSINNSFYSIQQNEKKKNKSNALGKFINEIVVPLHSNIFNPNNNNDINNETNNNQMNTTNFGLTRNYSMNLTYLNKLDHKIISESKFIENLLINIIPNLYDIYKIYFPHEVSISEDEKFIKDSSYKKYLIFLKEFEICPGLISKSISFQIFHNEVINPEADAEISENQEYYINLMKKIDINELTKYDPKNANIFGQFLNFFKFIRILVKISQVAYETYGLQNQSRPSTSNLGLGESESKGNLFIEKSMNRNSSNIDIHGNNNNLTLEDKFILTLERMELSEGFINLEKKTMRTHSKKRATLIPYNMIDNLKNIYNDKLLYNDKSSILLNRNEEEKKQIYVNNIRQTTNYLEVCQLTEYILENWGDELAAIFKGYCSFGDYLNTKYMTSVKFFKFLNDCKILNIQGNNISPFLRNESNRSLNVSRSVENNLHNKYKGNNPNLFGNETYKNSGAGAGNLKKINYNYNDNNNNNNNEFINKNLKENQNYFEGDSQIFGGTKIQQLKPNDIDSIFVKLCAISAERNSEKEKEGINKRGRDQNMNFQTGNSIMDIGVNSTILERSNSSNRLSVKKSKISKIEFDLFIVGLEVIACHLFEKADNKFAVDSLINDYILKNKAGKYTEKFKDNKIKIEYLKKKQDDPELLKILELIYDSFEFAYKYYSDKRGLIDFKQLMKFATDFQIFPYIVSKSKLNSYFTGICEYLNESNSSVRDNEINYIDQSLLVDILALCALDLNFREPEPSDIEKILYLLEKIADSDGPEKILKNSGHTRLLNGKSVNIIDPFKKAFPDYFKIPVEQKDEFYDILSGYYEGEGN